MKVEKYGSARIDGGGVDRVIFPEFRDYADADLLYSTGTVWRDEERQGTKDANNV